MLMQVQPLHQRPDATAISLVEMLLGDPELPCVAILQPGASTTQHDPVEFQQVPGPAHLEQINSLRQTVIDTAITVNHICHHIVGQRIAPGSKTGVDAEEFTLYV